MLPATHSAAHAFLAPSAAGRWVLCPGSARMEALHPEGGDKEAAAEGTACHWAMEMRFKGHMVAVGARDPAGTIITQEMVEAAELIYDDVITTLGPNWPNMVMVELRVNIPRVHAQNWGTPDVRAWVQLPNGRRVLYIWDLKFGHKHVEVFENWQLLDYAAGCMTEANDWAAQHRQAAFPESMVDIVLRVVQPRSYHNDGPIREWKLTADALRDFVFRLSMAADEATGVDPQCKPHPDACEYCSARHACAALQKAAYHAIEIAHRAQSITMTPQALGLELRTIRHALGLLEARDSGLAQQVESTLAAGKHVPFWAMELTGGRTRWEVAPEVVIATGAAMGLDLAKPQEPITPKQARDKGLDAGLVSAMSHTPAGVRKLKEDTGATARKTFT